MHVHNAQLAQLDTPVRHAYTSQRSLVALRDGRCVGGLTYKPHCGDAKAAEEEEEALGSIFFGPTTETTEHDFAELAFFVVTFDSKGIGIGARLMNRFKALLVEQARRAADASRAACALCLHQVIARRHAVRSRLHRDYTSRSLLPPWLTVGAARRRSHAS